MLSGMGVCYSHRSGLLGGHLYLPGGWPLTAFSGPMNKAQRQQRARIGGYTLAATHDPKQYTQAARNGFWQRFLNEVDPQRVLPEAERDRRAKAAMRAHMTRLALRSARARAKRKGS